MATGDQRREKDLALLDKLKSKSKTERTKAGLEALYAIRCNMFHGLKAFRVNQLEVLRPAIVLLQSTITVLQQALEEDDS